MTFPLSLLFLSVLTLVNSASSYFVEPPAPPRPVPGPYGNPHGWSPPRHSYISSLSPTMTSATNGSHTQTSSASPAKSTAASPRGGGDPCGPQNNQTDFESTLNTCGQINTTFTHAPSIYGVQCLNANPGLNQRINTTSCASNIKDLCSTVAWGEESVSQWNWSSGGPNCTVGLWFNPLPAARPSNLLTTCRDDIYQLMQTTCFPSQGGQFNVAAVNLQTLPDGVTTGSQVDSGYPSYIIVPETYNDVYTDGSAG